MIVERKGCCRRRGLPRPLKPLSFYANKETYTDEQDFIQKQTRLLMQYSQPMLVTGMDGTPRVRYQPFKPVTSQCWKEYQLKRKFCEEFNRLYTKPFFQNAVSSDDDDDDDDDKSDSESVACNPVEGLSSAPLGAPDDDHDIHCTDVDDDYYDDDYYDDDDNYIITVTKPVVEGLPCDPLDIPAAEFNNSLLDAQLPEITPPTCRGLGG